MMLSFVCGGLQRPDRAARRATGSTQVANRGRRRSAPPISSGTWLRDRFAASTAFTCDRPRVARLSAGYLSRDIDHTRRPHPRDGLPRLTTRGDARNPDSMRVSRVTSLTTLAFAADALACCFGCGLLDQSVTAGPSAPRAGAREIE